MEDQRTVICIGGAPTVGKTTLAKGLSRRLGMPWISTDTIREQLMRLELKGKHRFLFTPDNHAEAAERYLRTHSPEEISRLLIAECEDVWAGVRAFIEGDYTWRSFIIEGVVILPHLIKSITFPGVKILPVFLYEPDVGRTQEVIEKRGLWKYNAPDPVPFRQKEQEWVAHFNNWLAQEAHIHGMPLINVTKTEHDVERVAEVLYWKDTAKRAYSVIE